MLAGRYPYFMTIHADMAVFDALRHLSNYLYEAHTQSRHHLADLYELVQYAGNIIPRLYLMITVGSVYMSIPDAPVKEIMKDMMEMSRGVLHPIRGLFLRHYLSGQTRDHLPVGLEPGCVFYFQLWWQSALNVSPKTGWKLAGLYLVRPDQLYRNEQTMGSASTSRTLKGPGEARNGTSRTAHPRWHQSCQIKSARWCGSRYVSENNPSQHPRAGCELQRCHCSGIPHGGRDPGQHLSQAYNFYPIHHL